MFFFRDTTLMPNIHGLLPLVALVFAPFAEIRYHTAALYTHTKVQYSSDVTKMSFQNFIFLAIVSSNLFEKNKLHSNEVMALQCIKITEIWAFEVQMTPYLTLLFSAGSCG